MIFRLLVRPPLLLHWPCFAFLQARPPFPTKRGWVKFILNRLVENFSISPWAGWLSPVYSTMDDDDWPHSRRHCWCLVLYNTGKNHALINTQVPLHAPHPPVWPKPGWSDPVWEWFLWSLGWSAVWSGSMSSIPHGKYPTLEVPVSPSPGSQGLRSPWVKTAFLSCPVTTGFHISWN